MRFLECNQMLLQVTIEGLTGNITFEASGDRPGFRGFMCVVNPHPIGTYAPASHVGTYSLLPHKRKGWNTIDFRLLTPSRLHTHTKKSSVL